MTSTAVEQDLKAAEEKTAASLSSEVAKRIDALTEATRTSRYIDVSTRAALTQKIGSAKALLDHAARKTLLNSVQAQLVAAQIAGLGKEIADVAAPPVGFDATTWSVLATEMKKRLSAAATAQSPSERATLFEEALSYYLESRSSRAGGTSAGR